MFLLTFIIRNLRHVMCPFVSICYLAIFYNLAGFVNIHKPLCFLDLVVCSFLIIISAIPKFIVQPRIETIL